MYKARKQTSTSVDSPLSDQAKRVLVYAAEEADRLNHRHIGTEHLLLGLTRDKSSLPQSFCRGLTQTWSRCERELRRSGTARVANHYVATSLIPIAALLRCRAHSKSTVSNETSSTVTFW